MLIELEIGKAKKILETLKELEVNLGSIRVWNKERKKLLEVACEYFEFPNFIKNNIEKAGDYLIDSVLWSYLSEIGMGFEYREARKRMNPVLNRRIKEKREKSKRRDLYVELLGSSSLGRLPGGEVYLNESAYVFCNNIPIIITNGDSFFNSEDDFISEIKWTEKESMILMALINLVSVGRFNFFIDGGFIIPGSDLHFNPFDFNNAHRVKSLVALNLYVKEKTERLLNVSSVQYKFSMNFDTQKIKDLNKKIERENHVLLRCLYNFSKACSFSSHPMLMEEGVALQAFCLDGIIKLLMKKYGLNSFEKFQKWMRSEYDCSYLEYLEDLYEKRVAYVHPQNNILESWCPVLCADDYYETIDIVKGLILFYITEDSKNLEI